MFKSTNGGEVDTFRTFIKLTLYVMVCLLVHTGWCYSGEKAVMLNVASPWGFWQDCVGDPMPAAMLVDNIAATGATKILFFEQIGRGGPFLHPTLVQYAVTDSHMGSRDFLQELLVEAAAHDIKVQLVWTPPDTCWPGTENIPVEEGGPIYGLNDARMIALYNAVVDEIYTNYGQYIGPSNGNILEGIMFHEVDCTEAADNHTDDVQEFSSYCQTNFSESYTTGTMPTVDANDKWWRRYYLYKTSLVNSFMNQIKLNATGHNLKTSFIYYIPESAHGESWKWGYDVVGLENICDEMWVPGTTATDGSSGTDGASKPYTKINNCYIDFGPVYQNQVLSQNYASAFHGGPISWFWDRPAQYIDYIRSYYGDSQTWVQAHGDYYNDLLGVSEKELSIYLGQDNIANWVSQMGYWQGGGTPARIAVAVNPNPFIMKHPSDPNPDYNNKVFTLTKSLYPFMDVDSLIIGSQFALNSNNLQQYSLIIIPEDMGDGLSQATVDALTAYKNAGGKILVVATPLTKSNPDLTGEVDQTAAFCGLTVAGTDTSTSTLQPVSSTITLNNPNGGHWGDGKVGKALQFDGVDDYVNCGAGSSLDITDKLTIEAWIKPDTRSNYHVIACKNTYTYFFAVNSGKLSLLIGNSSATGWNVVLVGDTVLNSSNWYHVAGTYDSATGEAKLYINGVLDNTATGTAQAIGSKPTGWLSVGCAYGSAYYFNGVIDELNIYPRILSADELAGHSSILTAGQWALDDGQDSSVQDISGHSAAGTMNNFATTFPWQIQPTRRKTINNTGATTVVSDYSTGNPLLLQNGNVYFSTIGAESLSTGYFAQVIDYIADPPVKLTDNTGISIIEATRKDNALCASFSGPGTAILKVDTAGCGLSGSTFTVKEILTGRTLCSSISSTDLDDGFKINIKYYDEPYILAIGTSTDLAGFTGIFDSEETFEITSPDGWTTTANDTLDTPAGWVRDYSHAGMRSLKIIRTLVRDEAARGVARWVGKTITFSSPYPTTLTLGGWAKADSVGTGALFALQYDIVYSDYTTETYDADTRFDAGTHDWQQVDYVKTFSKGVKSITPKCVLSGANGTAWFDDLYINLNGSNLLYNGGVEILK